MSEQLLQHYPPHNESLAVIAEQNPDLALAAADHFDRLSVEQAVWSEVDNFRPLAEIGSPPELNVIAGMTAELHTQDPAADHDVISEQVDELIASRTIAALERAQLDGTSHDEKQSAELLTSIALCIDALHATGGSNKNTRVGLTDQLRSAGFEQAVVDAMASVNTRGLMVRAGSNEFVLVSSVLSEPNASISEVIDIQGGTADTRKPLLQIDVLSDSDRELTESVITRFPGLEGMNVAVFAETAAIGLEDKSMRSDERMVEKWQEQVFGTAELGDLRQNTRDCLERPANQRQGHEIFDEYAGRERRPILDISLEPNAAEAVTLAVQQKSEAIDRALEAVTEMASTAAPTELVADRQSRYRAILNGTGAWNRPHSNLLRGAEYEQFGKKETPGATIADLYLDDIDLQKLRKIDELIFDDIGRVFDSVARVTDGIITLAASTFPSGVEFMHATPVESLDHIIESGALAPRSQVHHGVQRKTQLNGAFVHLTGPSSVAYEYGEHVVIGVPIDTIVANSPRMQLEDAYIGNQFEATVDERTVVHSTQLVLDKLVINNLSFESSPAVFKAALVTMHANLQRGLRATNIGQGQFNNYSFAATDEEATAGQYSYPLEDISVYTDSLQHAISLPQRFPSKAEQLRRQLAITATTDNGGRSSLGRARLANFELSEMITVYAPIASEDVPFTESSSSHNSALASQRPVTFDTVRPDSTAKFVGELIASGEPSAIVIDRAIDSVNTKGGDVGDLLTSYVQNRDSYDANDVPINEVVARLDSTQLEKVRLTWLDYGLKGMTPDDKAKFTTSFGDRLFQENPDLFVSREQELTAAGYLFSGDQRTYIARRLLKLEQEAATVLPENPDIGMTF